MAQIKTDTFAQGKLTTPSLENGGDDEIVFLGGVALSNKSLLVLVEDTVKMCCQLITKLTGKSIPIGKYLPAAENKEPLESIQLYFVAEGDANGPDFRYDGSYLFVASEKESLVLPLQYRKDSVKKVREVLSGAEKSDKTEENPVEATISSTTGEQADNIEEEYDESGSGSEEDSNADDAENSEDDDKSSDSDISDGPGAMQDDTKEDPDFNPYGKKATPGTNNVEEESSDSISLDDEIDSDPDFRPTRSTRGRRGRGRGGAARGGKRKIETDHSRGPEKKITKSADKFEQKENVYQPMEKDESDSKTEEEVSENDFQVEKRVKKKTPQPNVEKPKAVVETPRVEKEKVVKPKKKNFWEVGFESFAPKEGESSCESAYSDQELDADLVQDSDIGQDDLEMPRCEVVEDDDDAGVESLLMEVEEDLRSKVAIDEKQQENLKLGFPLDILKKENILGFHSKLDGLETLSKLKFCSSLHCWDCKSKNLPRMKKFEFDVKWDDLETHMDFHKDSKLLFCVYAPHCQLVFFSAKDREKHAAEHQCDCCGIIKRDSEKLAVHKKVHNIGSLKDGYVCGECPPAEDQDIVAHLSEVHFKDRGFKGRVFACGFMNCRLLFLQPAKYLDHFNDTHRCCVCFKVFKNKNFMLKHKAICTLFIHQIEKGLYKKSSFMSRLNPGNEGNMAWSVHAKDIERNEALELAQEVRYKRIVIDVPVEGEGLTLNLKGMRFILLQAKFGLDAGEPCTLVVVEKKNPDASSPVLEKMFGEASKKLLAYSDKKLEIPDRVVDELGHTILCTPSGFDFLYKEGSLTLPDDLPPEEASSSGVVIKLDPDAPDAKKAQQVQIQYKCLSEGCFYFTDSHTDFSAHLNEAHSRKQAAVQTRYRCQACEKEITSFANLQLHIQMHVQDPGTISDKVVDKLKDLSAEQKLPGKDKLHICLECGRCFVRKSELLKHVRFHSTLKWPCVTCGRRMENHRHLALHSAKFHSNKFEHFCEVCYMQFPSFCGLMDHRLAVHIGHTTV